MKHIRGLCLKEKPQVLQTGIRQGEAAICARWEKITFTLDFWAVKGLILQKRRIYGNNRYYMARS